MEQKQSSKITHISLCKSDQNLYDLQQLVMVRRKYFPIVPIFRGKNDERLKKLVLDSSIESIVVATYPKIDVFNIIPKICEFDNIQPILKIV
jgi:hypothetical protein